MFISLSIPSKGVLAYADMHNQKPPENGPAKQHMVFEVDIVTYVVYGTKLFIYILCADIQYGANMRNHILPLEVEYLCNMACSATFKVFFTDSECMKETCMGLHMKLEACKETV